MFPTLLRIGDFQLATYGLLVASGYLAGIWWLSAQRDGMGLSEKRFWGLIYTLFVGAILGGKLVYWAVSWRDIAAGTLQPIRDIRYGFVYFGGFLGTLLAGVFYGNRYKLPYGKIADYFCTALPFGHAIGRLGCFMAGCCAGRPADLPWAVRFTDPQCLVGPGLLGVALHPTQLYEVFANLGIAAGLYALLKKIRAGVLPRGLAFAAYACLYAIARFVIEFYRGDDRGGFFLHLSVSQWIAAACFAAGAFFGVRLLRKRRA